MTSEPCPAQMWIGSQMRALVCELAYPHPLSPHTAEGNEWVGATE